MLKKYLLLICACAIIHGCSSHKYGYSMDKWNSFTQQERDKIQSEANDRLKQVIEEQRQREFLNKPINKTLGTRSNDY